MTGNKWRLAAKATCTTMASSFTGGIVAIVMSYYQSGGKVEVLATINGVLGALVGVTGKSGLMQSFWFLSRISQQLVWQDAFLF